MKVFWALLLIGILYTGVGVFRCKERCAGQESRAGWDYSCKCGTTVWRPAP